MTNGVLVASPRSQQPASQLVWLTAPAEDPLERVLDLGGTRAFRVMVVAIVVTLAFHGAAAVRTAYIHTEMIAWTQRVAFVLNRLLDQQIEVEEETPKPIVEVPEEKKEEVPVVDKQQPKLEAPAAASKAAQVIAQAPTDDVLNFDNVINVGDSDRFAGGATSSKGTADHPQTTARVAATGTGTGQPAPPQILATDLSRTATLAGSGEWRCPFPPEANADQVDEAAAVIEVVVGADGRAQSARVLQDPGHGFGREAKQCAMHESYVPALDREGKSVPSSKKFRVKFER